MNNANQTQMQRRRFLKLVSTGAVLAPFAGLAACSGGEEPADSGPAEPAATTTRPESAPAAASPQAEPQPSGDMTRLEESDPQARSLGYVHDATSVDGSRYPQYSAGQECANCALYLGQDGEEWGGCSIFPGKLVNARGWCSVYAPKA